MVGLNAYFIEEREREGKMLSDFVFSLLKVGGLLSPPLSFSVSRSAT